MLLLAATAENAAAATKPGRGAAKPGGGSPARASARGVPAFGSIQLSPHRLSAAKRRRLLRQARREARRLNRLYKRADDRMQAQASVGEAEANREYSRAGVYDPARPNILLVVSDDQPEMTTPVMKKTLRFFSVNGTIYNNAFVVTPICCPSRTQILSGQYGHNTQVLTNSDAVRYDEKMWVYDPLRPGKFLQVERLPWTRQIQCDLYRHGYRNAIFGKYINGWVPTSSWNPRGNVPSCFSPRHSWIGFDENHVMSSGNVRSRADSMFSVPESDYFLASKVNEFIRDSASASTAPWFALVSLHSPHLPITPSERYRRWRPEPGLEFTRTPNQKPYSMAGKPRYVIDAALRYDLDPYTYSPERYALGQQRMVKSIDDAMASMLKTLRRTGQLKNTIVIFISDNGHLWGNHGLYNKFYPYLESVRVPMMAAGPGIPAGGYSNRLVANIDIAPTLYHLTGVEPMFHMVDGYSIAGSYQRKWLLTESGQSGVTPYWAARLASDHHYIETARANLPGAAKDPGRTFPKSVEDIEYHEFYALQNFRGQEMENLASPSPASVPGIATLSAELRRAAWEPNEAGGVGCYGTVGSPSTNPCP